MELGANTKRISGAPVKATATINGKPVALNWKGWYRGAAGAIWRIPTTAKGKTLSGSLTVTYKGATLTNASPSKSASAPTWTAGRIAQGGQAGGRPSETSRDGRRPGGSKLAPKPLAGGCRRAVPGVGPRARAASSGAGVLTGRDRRVY